MNRISSPERMKIIHHIHFERYLINPIARVLLCGLPSSQKSNISIAAAEETDFVRLASISTHSGDLISNNGVAMPILVVHFKTLLS